MIYFDTSYLVKCYLPEPGSEEVRCLAADGGHLACCALGKLEMVAALHRNLREGELSERGFEAVMRQVELDDSHRLVHWFPVTEHLLREACGALLRLSQGVFVRSADCLHLTCAKEHGFDAVYSNDQHLLAAAPFFGLRGVNVLKQPRRGRSTGSR